MFIGSLRKRIAVQRRNDSLNDRGEPIPAWATVATLWGAISPLSGRELLAAQAIQSNVSHSVTLRWTGTGLTIDPSMRLVYAGREFDINGTINEDERNRVLVLACTERVGLD